MFDALSAFMVTGCVPKSTKFGKVWRFDKVFTKKLGHFWHTL